MKINYRKALNQRIKEYKKWQKYHKKEKTYYTYTMLRWYNKLIDLYIRNDRFYTYLKGIIK